MTRFNASTTFSIISAGALAALIGLGGCAGKKKAGPTDASSSETDVTGGTSGQGGMSEDTLGGSAGGGGLPTVHFDYDRSNIRPGDREKLRSAADNLKQTQDTEVTIEGHCDERGSIEYNLALGERRARAVKNYLTQLGVTGNRLKTISYGEERPANPNSDETAWAENRRAEMLANR